VRRRDAYRGCLDVLKADLGVASDLWAMTCIAWRIARVCTHTHTHTHTHTNIHIYTQEDMHTQHIHTHKNMWCSEGVGFAPRPRSLDCRAHPLSSSALLWPSPPPSKSHTENRCETCFQKMQIKAKTHRRFVIERLRLLLFSEITAECGAHCSWSTFV
jgi:hypothetical protein